MGRPRWPRLDAVARVAGCGVAPSGADALGPSWARPWSVASSRHVAVGGAAVGAGAGNAARPASAPTGTARRGRRALLGACGRPELPGGLGGSEPRERAPASGGSWRDRRTRRDARSRRGHAGGDGEGALERRDVGGLLGDDEGHDGAVGARAAGAAAAVDVVLVGHRRVVVDDQADGVDVDAARRDVGGDQGLRAAGREVRQRARALGLGEVGVDRGGGDALATQGLRDAVGGVLGAREDDRAAAAPDRARR